MGWDQVGTKDVITNFTEMSCGVQSLYVPKNTVISVAEIHHEDVVKMIEKYFGDGYLDATRNRLS